MPAPWAARLGTGFGLWLLLYLLQRFELEMPGWAHAPIALIIGLTSWMEVARIIRDEESRVENTLDLIAAENHAPASILEAQGSIFNLKAAEGFPGNRFHAGCRHADELEQLAISRARDLFGAEHANVQPHSGVAANLAVYFSVLDIGDRILSMKLSHGGHLSHGDPASIHRISARISRGDNLLRSLGGIT